MPIKRIDNLLYSDADIDTLLAHRDTNAQRPSDYLNRDTAISIELTEVQPGERKGNSTPREESKFQIALTERLVLPN